MLEALPQIAFIFRGNGQAIYFNRQYYDYIGEETGATPAERDGRVHPEDRAGVGAARTSGFKNATEYTVEARIRRHDGTYRWHRIHNRPIIVAGKPAQWLGTAVDIDDIR